MNVLFLLGFTWIFLIIVAFATGLAVGGPPTGRRWAGWMFRKGTDTICSLARILLLLAGEMFRLFGNVCRWARSRI